MSTTIERYALSTRAGDSFSRVITWTDASGYPVDLTDATVEWSLKRGASQEQYLGAPQAIITDAANGEITLALTFPETRALRLVSRAWQYELTVEFLNGTRTTILEGSLLIAKELVE